MKEMYTFSERKFLKNYNGNIDFLPKLTVLEKITKSMFFAIFLSKVLKQARKKFKILKMLLKCFDLNIHLDVAFSHFSTHFFASFLILMPKMVKKKLEFGKNVKFLLYLA